MHPADALASGLSGYPPDVHAFIEQLPQEAGLRLQPTRDNPSIQDEVKQVEKAIVRERRSGATPLPGPARGWAISWSSGWWMLQGHLYPGTSRDGLDPTSPLLLVERRDYRAIYGPELVPLARRVLADALASYEIRNKPWPREPASPRNADQ